MDTLVMNSNRKPGARKPGKNRAGPRSDFMNSRGIGAVGDLGFALKMKWALAYAHPGGRAQREQGYFAVR